MTSPLVTQGEQAWQVVRRLDEVSGAQSGADSHKDKALVRDVWSGPRNALKYWVVCVWQQQEFTMFILTFIGTFVGCFWTCVCTTSLCMQYVPPLQHAHLPTKRGR